MRTYLMGLGALLLSLRPAVANLVQPRYVSDVVTESLDFSGIQPPVYPPDGGCILVARLYKKDGKLRVYDSAPVCVPEATDFDHIKNDFEFRSHRLTIDKDDAIWVAYGWVFQDTKLYSAGWTGNIGCIWPDADVSKPCLAEHEYKPAGTKFPSPWTFSLISPLWTADRDITETV